MPDPSEVIAQARVQYERLQDSALAASPLAHMESWLVTGAPPPASDLRGKGLTESGLDEATTGHLRLARMAFTRRFGFSIPCAEAVSALVALSPLVEVGAGAGYWTAILRAAGADVVATDILAEGVSPHGFSSGRYCAVEPLDAESAVRRYPDRTVFCSWPTEGGAWAEQSFRMIAPGRALALIGDRRGGITGTPELFDLLDADFNLERDIELPQFPRVRDRLVIYRRR